ncbi:hypothetical protein ABZ904_08625 [Streptomyces sp. NPDC046900]|uniref:hypothetical protein n=1 Tax=Streptomyces sp. NPDC046900 TaxID=3155473 RepID=UPI0033C67763
MRTRATITLAAAVLLLAVTGCSSNDSSDDAAPASSSTASSTASSPAAEEPTTDDTASLVQAVKDYTAALFSSSKSGYDALSARCKKQMTKTEWIATAEQAHQQYGSQKATGVKVDQLSGDLARVSYGAGNIPQFEREAQSWTREGGTWRWDACPSTN